MSFRKLIFLLLLPFSSFATEFDDFFTGLMKREGVVFTFAKYDKGGPTKFGVTLKTYQEWSRVKGVKNTDKDGNNIINENDIRLLTINDVKTIYRTKYWDFWKSDSIAKFMVKSSLVDFLVNSGVGKNYLHVKSIQKSINAVPDGIVGWNTIKLINKRHEDSMLVLIYSYRLSFIDKIIKADPTQKIYEKGWKNRILYFLNKPKKK